MIMIVVCSTFEMFLGTEMFVVINSQKVNCPHANSKMVVTIKKKLQPAVLLICKFASFNPQFI